jgi:hypothetical protein
VLADFLFCPFERTYCSCPTLVLCCARDLGVTMEVCFVLQARVVQSTKEWRNVGEARGPDVECEILPMHHGRQSITCLSLYMSR